MLTCRELIDFLADYLDHALPPAEHAAFEEHLAECAECRAYLASYRDTVRLARHALDCDEQDCPPASVPPELVKAILAVRPREPV